MHHIAEIYPAFSPVFKGLVKYNEIQKTIQSNFNNYYRGIGSLSKEDNRTVKKVVVSKGGAVIIYKMMIYSWGGTFYFKNEVAITRAEYDQGTSY